ncbi:MAG: hypothetical protein Crog4KO_01510 [Crocinitomicaceae bacterium]
MVILCSLGIMNDSSFLAEESNGEEVEIEYTLGEEELEDFEDHFWEYERSIMEVERDFPFRESFHYVFSLHTFCTEPEEYPPC